MTRWGRIAHLGVVAAIFAALTFVAALSVATPAMAHNYYLDSTPSIGEVLTTLPDEFVVTTSDNLLNLDGAGNSFMVVTGPDGLYYGDGCVTVEGASVSMPATLGPVGDYTFEWQVVSADSHTISDSIPFRWQPATDAESTQGSPAPPICGEVTVPAPGEVTVAPTDEATPEPTDNALDEPATAPTEIATGEVSTDILWIGGTVLAAVALAIVATLLLLRRKKSGDTEGPPKQ